VSALGHEDVRGFDIPVDDAGSVSGIECVGDLNRQTEQNIGVDGLSGERYFSVTPSRNSLR